MLAEDLRRHVRRLPLKEAVNPSRRERLRNWARRKRLARYAALVPALALLVCPWFLSREGAQDANKHVRSAVALAQKDGDTRLR